jgi:hypothetical protein
MVMSAVSSVSTPGVLVTVMPRCGRGHVDVVDAGAEIGDQRSCSPAAPACGENIDGPVGDGRHDDFELLGRHSASINHAAPDAKREA